MNQSHTPFLSTRFIILALLSIAAVMTMVFTTAMVHAATPEIVAGENMMIGLDGNNVSVLQQLLSETGFLQIPAGVAFGHFGPLTKNALAQYQASVNVAPVAGYFGPMTKVAMYTDYRSKGWLPLLGW